MPLSLLARAVNLACSTHLRPLGSLVFAASFCERLWGCMHAARESRLRPSPHPAMIGPLSFGDRGSRHGGWKSQLQSPVLSAQSSVDGT
jgi:hypothetical protein